MRNYLLCALLAATIAVPTVASADHDDHHDHDRDHGHEHYDHDHWRDHEWHHHHHVYRDNYYMPYPAEPMYLAPAPVVVAPPMYAVPPSATLNVVLPR